MRYKRTPLNETSQQFMTGILKRIGFFTTKLGTFRVPMELKPVRASPPEVDLAHIPTIALVIKQKYLFKRKYELKRMY